MVSKPLQTTDSIHVCGHLITAFDCLFTNGCKVGKTNSPASNQSVTAHEQVQQIPGALFHLGP